MEPSGTSAYFLAPRRTLNSAIHSIATRSRFRFDNKICDWEAVLSNEFGTPYPPPPKPENLPLYPDDDGFYSVNGPAFCVKNDKYRTGHPLSSQISSPADQSPHISYLLQHPINTINELAVPLCQPPPPDPPPAPLIQLHRSPRKPPQRTYTCSEPGCAWRSPFRTKQGLSRHHQSKHLQKRRDCPIPGCKKVGNKGIKRKDNLRAHVWNQHGIRLPRESHRL